MLIKSLDFFNPRSEASFMTESPHARFERFAPEERLFHVESLPEALRLPPTVLRMATTELGTDWRRALV